MEEIIRKGKKRWCLESSFLKERKHFSGIKRKLEHSTILRYKISTQNQRLLSHTMTVPLVNKYDGMKRLPQNIPPKYKTSKEPQKEAYRIFYQKI